MPTTFLTTVEAGQRLGLTREQLVRLIGRGHVAAQYIAGRWVVDGASVQRYAEQQSSSSSVSKPPEAA